MAESLLFGVTFILDGSTVGTAVIALDERVIEEVDDEWRESFYPLFTPEDVAAHVGYNLVVNRLRLSQMDGWASHEDSEARVLVRPSLDDFEALAERMSAQDWADMKRRMGWDK